MAYKHGVYNTEQATSLTVPVQGSAGLQVIFGTAPIHLAKDPAAAVNTPKLVYSYKEAVEAVGYSDDFDTFTLCQSISACFLRCCSCLHDDLRRRSGCRRHALQDPASD